MKRYLTFLLLITLLLSLAACRDKTVQSNTENFSMPSQDMTTVESSNVKESKGRTMDEGENQTEVKELDKIVSADVEDTIAGLFGEYERLVADIDTYDQYLKNASLIDVYYTQITEETKALCIRMRDYSIDYAEKVMSMDVTNDDKYKELEELYDCIYDDVGEDIYDEIYDGILDDMYDNFYDGILDDAYDNGAPYDEWSDARSNEYDLWSDTRASVYDEWSDFRADVYDFWSDLRKEIWEDDIERAEDKIKDFREDIEKLRYKNNQSNIKDSIEEENSTSSFDEEKNLQSDEESPDGMRPEFKEAMDSYEAFYDEYCDFMKKYNKNPSDVQLLTEYTSMLTRSIEMTQSFEKWEDSEINDTELKYYLDVHNRVMKKLLEVAE